MDEGVATIDWECLLGIDFGIDAETGVFESGFVYTVSILPIVADKSCSVARVAFTVVFGAVISRFCGASKVFAC
jgi:hypothetical protein